ncbi:branched-chain-amino-acid transaminase [Malassezia yamatoensis]|uniref:Branched-chain-amino-acid aminotransferase n=1 Tax=Malassezia yamatoensis TaxID=253288 RepID=A0AAJ5YSS5_9BASI|nr:branched-chain-amino-acid transaminase [Malassezia yamatoensis]
MTSHPEHKASSSVSPLDASRLKIEKNPKAGTPPPPEQLVFGKTFTDHMLTVPWTMEGGWGEPKIQPYAPLAFEPSSIVFHYAPTLFEGLKAYKDPKGNVRLFRPDLNAARLNRSADRLSLPTLDGDQLVQLLKKIVEIDSNWVPDKEGYSLYVRPALIGTQASLGVGATTEALLFVIMSPVGPYYSSGVKPVALEANPDRVRAWPGGTGDAKIGANYGPCILPQREAAKKGYQQNLWLFGDEHYLTEVGTMNLFVVLKLDNDTWEVVTPPLNGMILPGVTRASVLDLLRDHEKGQSTLPNLPKIKVSEREIKMQELLQAEKNGNLVEVFGAGTAAVISPVDRIGYMGKDIHVPVTDSGFGPVADEVLKRVSAIQWGKVEHPWSVPVKD